MARIRDSKREAEERQYRAFEQASLQNASRNFPSHTLLTQSSYRRGIDGFINGSPASVVRFVQVSLLC